MTNKIFILKIVSAILILVTLFFNAKHGWAGLTNTMKPEETKMMQEIGIGKNMIWLITILSILVVAFILFPQTFFMANLINAFIILMVMGFSLKSGNLKIALIEIPFLLLPLVLIYLGHPLKK